MNQAKIGWDFFGKIKTSQYKKHPKDRVFEVKSYTRGFGRPKRTFRFVENFERRANPF